MSAGCKIVVILVFFIVSVKSDCSCRPIEKKFNETFSDIVHSNCRKCYVFSYDLVLHENWAPYLCVSSALVSPHTPLLVVAREYLSVTSLQVPQIFEDKRKSSFTNVCRTLCPLANYFDYKLNSSRQHIFVEVTSRSKVTVEYDMRLSSLMDFIVVKERPLTVNITPSQPRIVQYNMEHDLQAVRIEAESSDKKCMILAIEDIQCPFTDSDSLERAGFYQTLMTKSGISVTKTTFSMGRMYVVLILKTADDICTGSTESYESETSTAQFRSKEVTLRIVPAITDQQYYLAVFIVFIPYLLVYAILSPLCCCPRRNTVIIANIEESGSSVGDVNNAEQNAANSEVSNSRATMEPVIERKKVYLSDVAQKRDEVLAKRSKLYSWNLIAVAIFFGVPAFQLVFTNQRIVNLTGNQDLCYYNFLCSHRLGYFNDFNHIHSNTGYILLGIIFLLIVRKREWVYKNAADQRYRNGENEAVGVPYHFGLFYAMGAASIMEGVLSATYHVCPNKANFQFDTAFMYVIATMCILRLYQARHPDITTGSHIIWIILSFIIFINGADLMIPWYDVRFAYHIVIGIVYVVAVFLISVKIYYLACRQYNTRHLLRVLKNRGHMGGTCCWGVYAPEWKVQILTFLVVTVANIAGIICQCVQRGDFASFFLMSFIGNLLLYVLYYISMKVQKMREGWILAFKRLWIPTVYGVLAIAFWAPALYFFLFETQVEWQLNPAESRDKNSYCLKGLDFYDYHDLWHFLSSFGIFFSYMMLLTIDDDQQNEPRNQIEVF